MGLHTVHAEILGTCHCRMPVAAGSSRDCQWKTEKREGQRGREREREREGEREGKREGKREREQEKEKKEREREREREREISSSGASRDISHWVHALSGAALFRALRPFGRCGRYSVAAIEDIMLVESKRHAMDSTTDKPGFYH